MLVIRLARSGRRNQPKYRLVVAEKRDKLNGSVIDTVGHYNATAQDKPLVINKEAIEKWISQGAQPSNTVAKLLNREGFNLAVKQNAPRKPKKAPAEPAPAAAPVAEAPAEEAGESAEAADTEVTPAEVEAEANEPLEEAAPAEETPATEEAPAPEEAPETEAPEEPTTE